MKKIIIIASTVLLLTIFAIALPNHVPGIGTYTQENPAGFLAGIWHGWIAPISLILSILNSKITIFESINSGWWYNFGFYIAVISGFGGLTLSRSRKAYILEDINSTTP